MKKKLGNKFRLGSLEQKLLFDIDGELKDSFVNTKSGLLRVEHAKLQELGIEVMTRYGLNPDDPYMTRKEKAEQTTIENALFLTRSPDMAFVRHHQYVTETRESVYVGWSIKDIGPGNWWERVRR